MWEVTGLNLKQSAEFPQLHLPLQANARAYVAYGFQFFQYPLNLLPDHFIIPHYGSLNKYQRRKKTK